jgi:hypothetical protein
MIRPRRWSVLVVAFLLALTLRAEEKPAPPSPWAIDRALTVSPQGAPEPALRYRLLPIVPELKEGNAAPIYLRLIHEQNDAAKKYLFETPVPWNKLPVEKIPLDEARKFLQGMNRFLTQFEFGARRRTVEWNYAMDQGDPVGLLLPELQTMRNYTPLLVLQVRVALAEGDFARAARHIQTGLAFSRHVSSGPTVINRLVGIAQAWQFAGTVADFVERPEAPNLYWALTELPRPLIDMRGALEWEYVLLEAQMPELADLDRERTPEQWDAVLRRVRTEVHRIAILNGDQKPSRLPEWFPAHYGPDEPAAKSPDLAAARQYVARVRGLTTARVEAMPPAQVLLIYLVGVYHELRDDGYRALGLPYPQARPLVEVYQKRVVAVPTSEGHLIARMFLSNLPKILQAEIRLARYFALLRVIEALRMHAAAHEGQLPDKLDDVKEVPVPADPGTGLPFEYRREGDTVTLTSQIPGDPSPGNGLRFRVTIRKK